MMIAIAIITGCLNLNRAPAIDRIDSVKLMEDLYITSGSDLRLLLVLAGKDYPLIISKVLPIHYCIPVVECLKDGIV